MNSHKNSHKNNGGEFLFMIYYFFNIAIGFKIYGFWFGVLYMTFPIAPFVYIVERYL